MRRISPCILPIIIANLAYGQSGHEQFKILSEKKDSAKLNAFLFEWKKSGVNDPELYTACINYYYEKSKQNITYISKKQEGKSSLQITDSTGDVARI